MKRLIRFTLFLATFLFLMSGCAGYQNYSAKIEINENDSSYNLTTNVSDYFLILPKNNFVPIKPLNEGSTASPRYFNFKDHKQKLNVSGWFEPNYLYPGQKKYIKDMASNFRKKGLPEPEKVQHFRHNLWRVSSYEMPCGASYAPNIHAHLYEGNTWIDLHVSYDCNNVKKSEDLIRFIDTIKVVKK